MPLSKRLITANLILGILMISIGFASVVYIFVANQLGLVLGGILTIAIGVVSIVVGLYERAKRNRELEAQRIS